MFIPDFSDEILINNALKCLEKHLSDDIQTFTDAQNAKAYLRLQLGAECNEIFGVLFLDTKHRFLAFEKLFLGTINEAAVYPRVIVQRALAHNAAAVILSLNHPSGCIDPSEPDKNVTKKLTDILRIIDVNVLDHIIVSSNDSFSFAEQGIM